MSIDDFCDLVGTMLLGSRTGSFLVKPLVRPTLGVILNASELVKATAYIKYGLG
jgi:hypothetical protein